MTRQSPLLLLILMLFIFLPSLVRWMMSADGAWYRPYLIWALVIVATYLFQRKTRKDGSGDL